MVAGRLVRGTPAAAASPLLRRRAPSSVGTNWRNGVAGGEQQSRRDPRHRSELGSDCRSRSGALDGLMEGLAVAAPFPKVRTDANRCTSLAWLHLKLTARPLGGAQR